MTRERAQNHLGVTLGAVLILASAACTGSSTLVASSETTSPSLAPTVDDAPGPDIYLIDPGSRRLSVLLRAPGVQANAELSPDGMRVVYESYVPGSPPQIFTLSADGTTRQLTHMQRGASEPTWSPDGERIAFAGIRFESEGARYDSDIFVMDADGSHIQRLAETPRPDAYPDWSPDGSRIAFHSRFEIDHRGFPIPAGQIWVASVRGRRITKLTAGRNGFVEFEPAWSPDGRWIAFSRFHWSFTVNGEAVGSELWIMRPDGTHRRPVHAGGYRFRQVPSWSPDGHSIVFSLDGVVTIVDLRTKRLRSFRDTEADIGPSWSPGGILMSRSSTASDAVPARKFPWKRLPLVHLEAGTYFVSDHEGTTGNENRGRSIR